MRASWKGRYINKRLLVLTNSKKAFHEFKKEILHSTFELKNNLRSFYILEDFLNTSFFIHNGRSFDTINVDRNKVGFKFGDFSITKNYTTYSSKK